MYAKVEKAPIYIPEFPDMSRARKSAVKSGNKMLTACFGREFMALTAKQKVVAIYTGISFIAVCSVWSEIYPWVSLLTAGNLAFAASLANKTFRASVI